MNVVHQEYLLWFLVAAIIASSINQFLLWDTLQINQKIIKQEGNTSKTEIMKNRQIGNIMLDNISTLSEKIDNLSLNSR